VTGAEEGKTPAPVRIAIREPREEFCLAMLYQNPELGRLAADLDEDLFSLSENRELFRRWRSNMPIDPESDDEGDSWLREHYRKVRETRLYMSETAQVEAAFVDCVARLETARMKAVKEASALALAEGEVGVRPGHVASIAHARLEAGNHEDASEDDQATTLASQLLKDMEAGLLFHRRQSEGARPDQSGSRSTQQTP
jgi:hypothetical protein